MYIIHFSLGLSVMKKRREGMRRVTKSSLVPPRLVFHRKTAPPCREREESYLWRWQGNDSIELTAMYL
jgi:hypothetical protein